MPKQVQPIDLVWCDQGMQEYDWINHLLGDLPVRNIVVSDPNEAPAPTPGAIYVINTNKLTPPGLIEKIGSGIDSNRPVGLIHLADEWFDGGYGPYNRFDFVIRTHHAGIFDHPGILVVPLGWPNRTVLSAETKPSTQRRYRWCFVGNPIATRPAMISAFRTWTPNLCQIYDAGAGGRRPLSHGDFIDTLQDTVFCPAPMGNVMAETWRLYEALEAGAIPILERRLTLDYYRDLFGEHPLPTFSSWRSAAHYAKAMWERPAELDRLQTDVTHWWREKRGALQRQTQEFVQQGLSGHFRNDLARWRPKGGLAHVLWQGSQLTRHNTVGSLIWRARMTIRRGSIVSAARGSR